MDQEQLWKLIARKLAGEASEDELQELQNQLRLNPDLHYSLQTIYDLWHSTPANQEKFSENAYSHHVERMASKGIPFKENETPDILPAEHSPHRKLRPAAWFGLLLLVGLAAATLFELSASHPKHLVTTKNTAGEIITKNGSKTKFLLPDGTSVWLNAGSRLNYDSTYGNTIREVSLSGEAFFDVQKNATKPFIIHAGKLNIKVLGTAFNVKSYEGEKTIETSLIRGSVEVTFNDLSSGKIILKANQKLVVRNDAFKPRHQQNHESPRQTEPVVTIAHLSHLGGDSTPVETAWIDNRLIFNDESFLDLAKKMERWYGVEIDFNSPKADSLHFTGIFSRETVEQALNALRFSAPFTYSIQNNQIHIVTNQN
ncbi:MAG: FecR family protein [Puia sp.]